MHDVVGAPEPAGPTLSVHAYSPPLSAMSYYQVGADRRLHRTRTEQTSHPEAS